MFFWSLPLRGSSLKHLVCTDNQITLKKWHIGPRYRWWWWWWWWPFQEMEAAIIILPKAVPISNCAWCSCRADTVVVWKLDNDAVYHGVYHGLNHDDDFYDDGTDQYRFPLGAAAFSLAGLVEASLLSCLCSGKQDCNQSSSKSSPSLTIQVHRYHHHRVLTLTLAGWAAGTNSPPIVATCKYTNTAKP